MAHKTSCPSSGMLKDSTLDRPQFHSSEEQMMSKTTATKPCMLMFNVWIYRTVLKSGFTHFMFTDFYNNFSCCCEFMVSWKKNKTEFRFFPINHQQTNIRAVSGVLCPTSVVNDAVVQDPLHIGQESFSRAI